MNGASRSLLVARSSSLHLGVAHRGVLVEHERGREAARAEVDALEQPPVEPLRVEHERRDLWCPHGTPHAWFVSWDTGGV
jgi:hypothetical protein